MDESSNHSAPNSSPSHHHQNNNSSNANEEDHANESANTTASLNEEVMSQEPIANGHHEANAQSSNSTEKPSNVQIKVEPSTSSTTTTTTKPPEHNKAKPKPHPKANHDNDARKAQHHQQESSASYKVVQDILHQEGALKWDNKVSQQLQEFMYQITSQMLDHAKSTAEHRNSGLIGTEDVDEALESFNRNIIMDRTEFEQKLHESAERLNTEPLPKIRSEAGMHAPNERFMIIQPDYQCTELDQMNYEPVAKSVRNNFHTAPSNVYSTAIVEQTFNNQNDPSEFD